MMRLNIGFLPARLRLVGSFVSPHYPPWFPVSRGRRGRLCLWLTRAMRMARPGLA